MKYLRLHRLIARLPVVERSWVVPALVAVVGLLSFSGGIWLRNSVLLGGGAVSLCFAVNRWLKNCLQTGCGNDGGPVTPGVDLASAPTAPETPLEQERSALDDSQGLIEQMQANGRYALLLRPQLIGNLDARQLKMTSERFNEGMSLIPAGQVRLAQYDGDDGSQTGGQIIAVDPAFLDRYAVTNRQFWRFVEAGGYGDLSLWDVEALPALIYFVDQSGLPGPAYWSDGSSPRGEDELPVVGVSWYEAQAYARWVGKRLPSDAEWVKAASWPVHEPGQQPQQRIYPWGEEMDTRRANVWDSGEEKPVAVNRYAEGMSAGGVYQLVGNVWEWTASEFGTWHPPSQRFAVTTTLRSIRGGAYDTYFPSHCTNHFQSGECPTSRQQNTGFRCAVSACDLAPLPDLSADPTATDTISTEGVLA